MEFKPPFNEFKFSNRRDYTLLSGDSNSVKLSDYSDEEFDQLILKTFNTLDVYVVGHYNRGIGFFIEKDSCLNNGVYTLCLSNSETELTKVADSVESLYKICSEIKSFIEKHDITKPLVKNEKTVAEMKKIISEFQIYSPNSYSRFWQEHAMGELMIGLEL